MAPDLLDATAPVLGTAAIAKESPCPYGIGVYSVASNGATDELALYYVSPKVALARGRGVEAGWYVCAVPEKEFEVRVTAVQPNFPKLKGRKVKKGNWGAGKFMCRWFENRFQSSRHRWPRAHRERFR